jgi:8-oxo-dGTP pyrophosphatase MutT (NUDIX family)
MRATLIGREAVELDIATLKRMLALPRDASGDSSDPGALDDATLRPASVLVPIVAREEGLTVLFTRRTERLRNHSGQVAFPGGREEPQDGSPEAAALRETREEIGLDAAHIELIGRLDQYRTRTGFRITPVVGIVQPPFALLRDPHEVDEIFEVPLSFLLDPANHAQRSREFEGRTARFYVMQYGTHCIWGATAGMLVAFYRRLAAL